MKEAGHKRPFETIYYDFCIYNVHNRKIHRNKKQIKGCLELGGLWGNTNVYGDFSLGDENVPILNVVMVA